MTTAATIVKGALGLLRVIDANEAPDPDDAATATRSLNAMMAAWLVDGWALGWVAVTEPTDILQSPEWADEAITYNLALRLRPHYGVTLDPDVIGMAQAGMSTVAAYIARKVEADDKPRVSYADLPRGTGQRDVSCDPADGFGT